MHAWASDLRFALRGLGRSPGLAAAAVVVLSLGLGLNVAVFTIADAALFRGYRGVTHPDRVVFVTTGNCCVSYLDILDWRAAAAFTGIGAVADLRVAVERGGSAQTATATEVTANTFALLGVAPRLGRDFTSADDRPGAPPVAMLGHDYWQRHFDGAASVLGQSIRVNGLATTVVGVMPEGFLFPQRQDLWLPLGRRAAGTPRDARGLWFGVARLADGVSLTQARAELATLGATLAAAYPDTNARVRPVLQTFRELFVGADATAIYGTLWLGVSLVLVVACANLANLLLARMTDRARELAVRLALGAGRGRIVRQQCLEALLLSFTSGVAALGVAQGILRLYDAVSVPPTQPWAAQLLDYSLGPAVVVYVVVLAVVTGVVLGAIPMRRVFQVDALSALRESRGGVGGSRRAHRLLVITQVAFAVVLLSAAGVLLRSVSAIARRSLGYDPSHIAMTLVTLPADRYPNADAQQAFRDRLGDVMRRAPNAAVVAFVDGSAGGRVPVEIEGRAPDDQPARPEARVRAVSPEYFATLGVTLVNGRAFDERDGSAGRLSAIVSRTFAERYWQTVDVAGRRLRLVSGAGSGSWLTVAGVAPDLRQGDPTRDIEPAIYVPFRQRPAASAWLLARTPQDATSLIAPMRAAIAAVDTGLPVWLGPYPMAEWTSASYWRRSVNGTLFAVFAAVTLVLACLGVFAVVTASVARRRREIGVRLAVGAQARDVVSMCLWQGLTPVLGGLAGGLVASIAANQLLRSQLVDVTPADATTMAAVALLLVATTSLACALPARRAARIDPTIALRDE